MMISFPGSPNVVYAVWVGAGRGFISRTCIGENEL